MWRLVLAGGGEQREAEEMLLLGDLTVRVAMFLTAVTGAYAFFAYAISVSSLVLLASSIAPKAGVDVGGAAVASSIAGVALGYALSTIVPGRARRYARSVLGGGPRGRAVFWAAFLAGFALGYQASGALPGCLGDPRVAWYLGLEAALGLAGAALLALHSRGAGVSFLVAGAVGLALTPLVVYACSAEAAVASMMLGYLAGGSWALWEASKVFTRPRGAGGR